MSEQLSWWRRYVFSTDHKVVSRQYLITGIVMAVIGGLLAYGMRMQLAYPGASVFGLGKITPERYNMFLTMHGTIMVFWVAMPILLAAFGNLLIPLMVGADDMVFPRLNMLSYWTFFVSTVLLVASFYVPGGAAAGGWTSYPPLSATKGGAGFGWGMNLWLIAVAAEFASFLMGGVNFVATAISRKAEGMTIWRWPIMVWMILGASVLFLLSVGPLIAGAILLLMDRLAGTGFYSPAQGGDPLLFQHLFWFFGHPEVYVLLLPSFGILAEVLTAHARKPLFGYKTIVYSVVATGIMSFIVWAHHSFVSGIDPRMAAAFSVTTILISVPVAITLFSFIATLYGGSIRFTSAMMFALAALSTFLLGGVTGIPLGSAANDVYLHDTYFVVAHFHYTLFPTVVLGGLAGLYHWWPKFFGTLLPEWFGRIHAVVTFLSFNTVFIPLFVLGLHGHQRRIAFPNLQPHLAGTGHLQKIATVAAVVLVVMQLLFCIVAALSILRRKKVSDNPWEATTLEWATPSPPPHGNFATTPVVVCGPYEYAQGGAKDYRMQHEGAGA